MSKCDLDDCSLTKDIGAIKKSQTTMQKAHNDMMIAQAVLVEKIDGFVTNSNEKHTALFERTKGNVKWTHLATVAFVLSAIVGIVWKLASGG